MNPSRYNRPKFLRQAEIFACLFILALNSPLEAQPKRFRPQPEYAQIGKPDPHEGLKILNEFRSLAFPSDYYWEFELRVMPRRGPEKSIPGQIWGSRNERGPISRVQLNSAAQQSRLLIQNGPQSALWTYSAGETILPQKSAGLFMRMADTDLTPFDLQMPFIYWSEFVYEGVRKLRDRPAHSFLFYPPSDIALLRPELTGVRLFIDTQFQAPVEIRQIGASGVTLKTFSVNSVIKIDDQWTVKSIDLRDESTRNKIRFQVTKAALNLEFSPMLFSPAELAHAIQPPSEAQLRVVAP